MHAFWHEFVTVGVAIVSGFILADGSLVAQSLLCISLQDNAFQEVVLAAHPFHFWIVLSLSGPIKATMCIVLFLFLFLFLISHFSFLFLISLSLSHTLSFLFALSLLMQTPGASRGMATFRCSTTGSLSLLLAKSGSVTQWLQPSLPRNSKS